MHMCTCNLQGTSPSEASIKVQSSRSEPFRQDPCANVLGNTMHDVSMLLYDLRMHQIKRYSNMALPGHEDGPAADECGPILLKILENLGDGVMGLIHVRCLRESTKPPIADQASSFRREMQAARAAAEARIHVLDACFQSSVPLAPI